MNDTSIYVLIPAYNEAERIESVIRDLHRAGWRNIIVVNDGSTDTTAELARQSGAHVLTLSENHGQGTALQAGFHYIRPYRPRAIVTFDADGQHHADDIETLVAPVVREQSDIVLGSRFLRDHHHIPRLRRMFLKMGVWLTRLVVGLPITDVHNGLRALGPTAYNAIQLTQPRMAHASEILELIAYHKLRWQEIPVRITYEDHTYKRHHHWLAIPLAMQLLWFKVRRVWIQYFPQAN